MININFFNQILRFLSTMRGCHDHHPYFGQKGIDTAKISNVISEIKAACKGSGTDEKRLIAATASCNAMERDVVCLEYNKQTSKHLVQLLKSELNGNLEKLFVGLYSMRYVFWAQQINAAVMGMGTDEKKLIDLIISCADNEMAEVDRAYTQLYKVSLLETISSEGGAAAWVKLLRSWVLNKNTAQGNPEQIAKRLREAAKGAGTDEAAIIDVLTGVSHNTYRAVDQEFQRLYQKSLRSVLKSEFSGKSEYAFLAAHDYMIDPVRFVANMLYVSMKGIGTDDDKLIYTTVLHCDWCGPWIGVAYEQMGFGDLRKDIKSDLSGKYETAVLGLWHL
uniref:Annexin 9 n=1 Tax=Spironucleus vortens TaxID=58336 RepID=A0A142C677_SPIVO|nr:annexin 9 [Spironucleus vortens]